MTNYPTVKEDLVADATGMPTRGSWRVGADVVFVGWRPSGHASLFWNEDPVLQFDSKLRIRRAFYRGTRIAAEKGRLVWLQRVKEKGRVRMQATPLSEAEAAEVCRDFESRIATFGQALAGRPPLIAATIDAATFHSRCVKLIADLPLPLQIARSPSIAAG